MRYYRRWKKGTPKVIQLTLEGEGTCSRFADTRRTCFGGWVRVSQKDKEVENKPRVRHMREQRHGPVWSSISGSIRDAVWWQGRLPWGYGIPYHGCGIEGRQVKIGGAYAKRLGFVMDRDRIHVNERVPLKSTTYRPGQRAHESDHGSPSLYPLVRFGCVSGQRQTFKTKDQWNDFNTGKFNLKEMREWASGRGDAAWTSCVRLRRDEEQGGAAQIALQLGRLRCDQLDHPPAVTVPTHITEPCREDSSSIRSV